MICQAAPQPGSPESATNGDSRRKRIPVKGWREKMVLSLPSAPLVVFPGAMAAPAGSLPGTGRRLSQATDTSVQTGKERLVPRTGSCRMLSRGTDPTGSLMLLSDDLSPDWDPWSSGIRDLRGYGDCGPDPSFIWEMVRTLKPHRAVQWYRGGPSQSHTRYQLLNCPRGQALWLVP